MSESVLCFTETEYRAFEALFDAAKPVLGSNEHRLVDPVTEIGKLFDHLGEADRFVKRLVDLNLLSVAFIRPGSVEDGSRPTYRAAYEQWPDVAGRITRVPDPPFKAEEQSIREAAALKRERRKGLVDRQQTLVQELQKINEQLVQIDAEIKKADGLADEFADWRRRIADVIGEK